MLKKMLGVIWGAIRTRKQRKPFIETKEQREMFERLKKRLAKKREKCKHF